MLKNIGGGGEKVTIIGKSASLLQTKKIALQTAKTIYPVYLSGESGAGKSLFARFIHANSPRSDKPFVTVNCANIAKELLESELFGHEKGAFSGALFSKKGKFELANGGTLFLDEIGDLSLPAQAKLLRVLQEKEFERLGGIQTIKVDVKIISATNKNVDKMIAEEIFREDLFYRLNVLPIEIPSLRDRPEDIPALIEYILSQHSNPLKRLDPKAMTALRQHSYSRNNIREMENIIIRAIVLAGDIPLIRLEHLVFPASTVPLQERAELAVDDSNLNLAHNIGQQLNDLVKRAMDVHHGTKSQAAKALGISPHHLTELLIGGQLTAPQICVQYLKAMDNRDEFAAASPKQKNRPRHKKLSTPKPDKLTHREKQVLSFAQKSGNVTNKMLQLEFKISDSTAHRLLTSLAKRRLIVLQGEGRTACYILA